MKWFKRFLWLAAWSFWVWLGVGLYRELPRDLGRPLCTLSIGDETVLGFLPGKEILVSQEHGPATNGFRYWNGRNGSLIVDFDQGQLDVNDKEFLRIKEKRRAFRPADTDGSFVSEIERLESEIKLSPDGRFVVDWSRQILQDASTKELLHRGGWNSSGGPYFPAEIRLQTVLAPGGDPAEFATFERWDFRLGNWGKWFETIAVRSFEDQTLHYRIRYSRGRACDSGTLFIDLGHSVYALPPRPDYLLLVLCQAILALPLVLLWLVMRWRRKRQMRMATHSLEFNATP